MTAPQEVVALEYLDNLSQPAMTSFESLFAIYKMAVFQKDIEAYVSIYDDEIRAFDMWEQWSCDGLEAWRKMAETWFTSLGTFSDVVEFDDIRVCAAGEMATASAFVKFTAVSEKGEELRYLQNRLTWIAQQKNGNWKIIHQHTSGPIDFKSMQVRLTR